MVGRWPIFVPGFFAIAIGSALWARGKDSGKLCCEGVAALSAATLIARSVAGFGAGRLIRSFERDSGFKWEGGPLEWTWAGSAVGGLTAAGWSALIIGAQRAVATRRVWPLVLPLTLYSLFTALRLNKLDSLDWLWMSRVIKGDRVALNSSVLAAVTAVGLWKHASRARGAARTQ